jgi:hypothetical protein
MLFKNFLHLLNLSTAYREMAAEHNRELAAEEWCKSIICDVADKKQ